MPLQRRRTLSRQSGRQTVKTIKRRVRDNAFTYTQQMFESMVHPSIYEEDITRGFSTARWVAIEKSSAGGTIDGFNGFGMNEEPIAILCRLERTRVKVLAAFWTSIQEEEI